MKSKTCASALIGLALASPVLPAHAALVSITGEHFDLQYDDTKLGLFGTPVLVGDTLYFTPNNFVASSVNGSGVTSTYSTVSGLVFTAKGGARFGGFELTEFGDYTLSGAGSSVRVQGQLRAFNVAQATTTQTTADLVVDPATPLTLADGLNHNWTALARIDSTSPVVPPFLGTGLGGSNVLVSQPSAVGLTIENRLLAYTDPGAPGLREAFIEKKFVGVGLTATVSPVPLPPAQALLAAGLGLGGLMLRSRRPAPQAA